MIGKMVEKITINLKKLITKPLDPNIILYCPLATKDTNGIVLPTRGDYANNYPIGAVIHYTAGRSLRGDTDALNTLIGMAGNSYCAFVISSTGTIFQNFPLNRWGDHAGQSEYKDLGKWLSNKLVGIELCCAGKLLERRDRNIAWFGEEYPDDKVRKTEKGTYHRYTDAQEHSLSELLLWLKNNNPNVFKVGNVLGHDEIAPGRKTDPGGSLSMPMPQYRELLIKSVMEKK
jgi:N-acetyl-anhydromuramyl-L-alanine amidase AmpD